MPFLNWKELKIESTVQELPSGGSLWKISASAADFRHLGEHLEAVLSPEAPEGYELRLNLPEEWTLFWKRTESASKLLLARPEKGQWVGTIALQAGHGAKVIALLKKLEAGQSLRIGELGEDLHPVNNLELELIVSTA